MKFTVITPTCGMPQGTTKAHFHLKDCLLSIQASEHQDFEALIGADGPMPEVAAIVASMADPRFRYIACPLKNQWGNPQRNLLIEQATGDYVVFVDHDDSMVSSALKKAAEFAERNPGTPLLFDYNLRGNVVFKARPGAFSGGMMVAPRGLLGRFTPEWAYNADYFFVEDTCRNAIAAGKTKQIMTNAVIVVSRPWFAKVIGAEGYHRVQLLDDKTKAQWI